MIIQINYPRKGTISYDISYAMFQNWYIIINIIYEKKDISKNNLYKL